MNRSLIKTMTFYIFVITACSNCTCGIDIIGTNNEAVHHDGGSIADSVTRDKHVKPDTKNCTKNADCGENGFCDEYKKCYYQTVECTDFCENGKFCNNGKCEDAPSKAKCNADQVYSSNGNTCLQKKCTKDSDCQYSNVCQKDGYCGGCRTDNNCSSGQVCFENPHYKSVYQLGGRSLYQVNSCELPRYKCKTDSDCGQSKCILKDTWEEQDGPGGRWLIQAGTCHYEKAGTTCAIRSMGWNWIFHNNVHQMLFVDPRTGYVALNGIKGREHSGPISFSNNAFCVKLLNKDSEFINMDTCHLSGMVLVKHPRFGQLACVGTSKWDIKDQP